MSPEFEIGIQLHLPTFRHATLPDFVDFGRMACAGGVSQLWVTDNLRSRSQFVVLTALAGSAPLKLGTAVTVQYFRNPVDVADSVAAITELMDGREFGLGLARGNRNTPSYVRVVKPISMLRETAISVRRLLAGEAVKFADYPTVASYFNLLPDASFKLNFLPKSPVLLYCGGNGPKALAVGGACMDGILFGGTFQSEVRAGHMAELLQAAEQAAVAAGRRVALRKVAEIKLSVARDGRAAREFTKHSVAGRIVSLRERGFNDDDYRRLRIAPADIDRLQQAEKSSGGVSAHPELVTDAMIDAIFVAGDTAHCREKMVEVCAMARAHGYQQLMFSELGPDLKQGLRLLCDEILPSL
ncbi:MAG: LLM class flavin-dependent oxidoreductase [Betaproteobacteria bacterium]|nr:LLM class flavin-dependent oxidoreductase [Betaproteobacteria bacterium]